MYKTWRFKNSVLGIVRVNQIAFGSGVRWCLHEARPLCSICAWLNIGPLHIWFGWDIHGGRR
mgnify:CR=1 FL=1